MVNKKTKSDNMSCQESIEMMKGMLSTYDSPEEGFITMMLNMNENEDFNEKKIEHMCEAFKSMVGDKCIKENPKRKSYYEMIYKRFSEPRKERKITEY